ncbi:MAG: DUF1015 family protein [Saprospiraceae bacterium]
MNLVPFQAIYPNLDLVTSPELFFKSLKSKYVEYNNSGFFRKSSQESIYVYQLKTENRVHKGIITSTEIGDFINGKVLKHENTLAAKEQIMMNLMLQNKAMVKPVLLAYDNVIEIDAFINKIISTENPFFEINFDTNQEVHTIWQVTDGDVVNVVSQYFKNKVPHCYIADGHHRVKTSILLHTANKSNDQLGAKLDNVLSIYFSWDELAVYDYNRCIDVFQNHSPLQFMASLSQYFKIKPIKRAKRPKQKHEMTMVMYGEWYRLRIKPSILANHSDEVVLFDTFILNEYVLKAILGIENAREDIRIHYLDGVAGPEGMENLVAKKETRVGFCLFPINYSDIKIIADNDKTLPPKSTWFEPRIKNGIIIKDF